MADGLTCYCCEQFPCTAGCVRRRAKRTPNCINCHYCERMPCSADCPRMTGNRLRVKIAAKRPEVLRFAPDRRLADKPRRVEDRG